MDQDLIRQCLRHASLGALATAAWWFHRDLSAPDACLDAGGAFDYARWLCDADTRAHHLYIDTPLTGLPSFPVFCACVAAFVAVHWMRAGHRRRHGTRAAG